MGKAAGGVSGGTVASLMYVAEQASRDPVRELVMDPYALYPVGIDKGLDVPDQRGISWDDHFESWTGPFVMAAIKPRWLDDLTRSPDCLTDPTFDTTNHSFARAEPRPS